MIFYIGLFPFINYIFEGVNHMEPSGAALPYISSNKEYEDFCSTWAIEEFLDACTKNNLELINVCLNKNPNLINAIDRFGNTGLHQAARKPNPEVILGLINAGADIFSLNKEKEDLIFILNK